MDKYHYVDSANKYINEAKDFAFKHSTDLQHQTGSVLVKDGQIIGRGANQSRLKNKKLFELHNQGFCLRKILKIKSGKHYWLCPGCSPCRLHSEQEAIKDAKKNNQMTSGSDLYLWGHWWCCESCWGKIVEAGIKNVYLLENSNVLFRRESKKNIIGK